ncbi:MYXO-CTERM sorting domain-containing protein [Nannocystis pusilla]|uniref:MYXO-CTERM sorting domain-containing protein n=1 Tax=Nannocystis pusilla TaxID=889268 RepID=UPI003B7CAA39
MGRRQRVRPGARQPDHRARRARPGADRQLPVPDAHVHGHLAQRDDRGPYLPHQSGLAGRAELPLGHRVQPVRRQQRGHAARRARDLRARRWAVAGLHRRDVVGRGGPAGRPEGQADAPGEQHCRDQQEDRGVEPGPRLAPLPEGAPTTSASDTDTDSSGSSDSGPDSATGGGQNDAGGCGCRSDGAPGGSLLALAGLGLLARGRRRR